MVDRLITVGCVRGAAVEHAFRSVPRHMFVPGVIPTKAYTNDPIVTQHDAEGAPLNSSSQPSTTAAILEQLSVAPGDRVLEIGTGTGYDAALLAELAGPDGQVVTVDIDPVMACEAREHLVSAGYERVEVLSGDGWAGSPGRAPFGRVISTVGVWDVSPAWPAQLDPFGMMVLPLWLRAGLQVSVALRRDLDRLTSTAVLPCGLMRLRGRGAGPEAYVAVDGRSACLDHTGAEAVRTLATTLTGRASVVPLGRPLPAGWFTSLALAAPDSIQMAWFDPVRGYVTASGVFDAQRGGLALIVPGRGGAEMHAHGDPGAAERLRGLLGGLTPVRVGELRIDLLPAHRPVPATGDVLAVLRRPNTTVVVRHR
ncbi:MAG TPA: methyltransferase domain-containing protein [Mycobacteriales bacterium]|nr:methyltransferase domain-containing protein [Mycobacteriales bacterium]